MRPSASPSGVADSLAGPQGPRRRQLIEVLVFLSLIVPGQILTVFAGQPETLGFDLLAWAVILRDLSLVALIFFFLARNGERARDIGVSATRARTEVALGVLLFLPFTVLGGALEKALQSAGFSAPARPLPAIFAPHGGAEMALAGLLVIVVAVTEEIIFRGYLITRFRNLTNRPGVGLVLAAVVFALGHGYEGSSGMITVGVMGLVFGLLYLWRGTLVAAMTLHFLQDFTGIVIAPLLSMHP